MNQIEEMKRKAKEIMLLGKKKIREDAQKDLILQLPTPEKLEDLNDKEHLKILKNQNSNNIQIHDEKAKLINQIDVHMNNSKNPFENYSKILKPNTDSNKVPVNTKLIDNNNSSQKIKKQEIINSSHNEIKNDPISSFSKEIIHNNSTRTSPIKQVPLFQIDSASVSPLITMSVRNNGVQANIEQTKLLNNPFKLETSKSNDTSSLNNQDASIKKEESKSEIGSKKIGFGQAKKEIEEFCAKIEKLEIQCNQNHHIKMSEFYYEDCIPDCFKVKLIEEFFKDKPII